MASNAHDSDNDEPDVQRPHSYYPYHNQPFSNESEDSSVEASGVADISATNPVVAAPIQPRGKTFPPPKSYADSSDEDDDDDLVEKSPNNLAAKEEVDVVRPNPVAPRGKELRLTKKVLGGGSSSDDEATEKKFAKTRPKRKSTPKKSPTKKESSSPPRKKAAAAKKKPAPKKDAAAPKIKINAKAKEKAPVGSKRKRKAPPPPASSDSETDTDEEGVVTAVVVEGSDSDNDVMAIAEPIKSNKKIKTKNGTPKKAPSKKSPPNKAKNKTGGKKTSKKKSIEGKPAATATEASATVIALPEVPPEKAAAAQNARSFLQESVTRLPYQVSKSHVVRSFGRVKPEYNVAPLDALYSSPHAIYPIGFSCDRFDFSPVHGRMIRMRCDILDGSSLKEQREEIKRANEKINTTNDRENSKKKKDPGEDAQDDVGDGPIFRVMWGLGVEEDEFMEPSYPFDLNAASTYDVDAVAIPLSSKPTAIPEIGMRVSVKFDQCKMYGGTITKVSTTESTVGNEFFSKPSCDITIQYDDGVSEDTTYPDPDIHLVPPGSLLCEPGNGMVREIKGKPVHCVLAKSSVEAWGKTLISLGLIDEIMYERALKSLQISREEGLTEVKDKIDLSNKQRREARAREKRRHSTRNDVDDGKMDDDVDSKQSNDDQHQLNENGEREPPSSREIELRGKLKELENILAVAKKRSKSAAVTLANTRISIISPFALNPFIMSEESTSQEMIWMASAVKKEKSKMGATGNKRKVVTPATMLEKSDTFFIPEIERLVEGLPGTEFTPSYIFRANRSAAAAASLSWIHEAKLKHQKEQQKKLEKEQKAAREAEAKASAEREKELKRLAKEEEIANRKRVKEEEEEKRKRERIERRISQLTTQMDDRLLKDSCVIRERSILNLAKGMSREFNRRRKAAEMVVGHKLEVSLNSEYPSHKPTTLAPFIEMLPPLSRSYDEEVVRIWDFFHSFSDAFSGKDRNSLLPTLDSLQNAIDCLKSDPCDQENRSDAIVLVKDIAMSLCKVISPSITKTLVTNMGMNSEANTGKSTNEAPQEDLDLSCLPVTEWTWREIARMIIVNDALLDLGYSKQESANILKGIRSGGHPNSKEAKRLKKIEDAPLIMTHQQLNHQDTISSKYRRRLVRACLSIPFLPPFGSSDWRFFLNLIKSQESCSQSFFIDNVEKSLSALRNAPASKESKSNLNQLEKCLSIAKQSKASNGSSSELNKAKKIAFGLLKVAYDKKPSETRDQGGGACHQRKKSLLANQTDPTHEPMRQKMGLLRMHQLSREQYRASELSKEDYMAAALRLKEDLERKNNGETMDEDDDDDDEEDDDVKEETTISNASNPPTNTDPSEESNSLQTGSTDRGGKTKTEPNSNNLCKDDSHPEVKNGDEASDDASNNRRSDTSPVLKGGKNDTRDNEANNPDTEEKDLCGTKTDYEFCEDVPQAPDLIRRCLAVMRTLCATTSAEPFIYPVDPQLYPGYYEAVVTPLSLYDVGNFLQEAGQRLSSNHEFADVEVIVAEVGRKVRTIVQNSLFYSSGFSTVNSAEEMIRIFERLFFDWVLAPSKHRPDLKDLDDDRCIEHHESDLTSMVLLCDGCEGKYNMSRLKPPLTKVPTGDWYCPRCVSGRCWTNVDPRLGKHVQSKSFLGTIQSCKFILSDEGKPSLVYSIKSIDSGVTEVWGLEEVDSKLVDGPVDSVSCFQALSESPGYGFGRDNGGVSCVLPLHLNPFVSDNAAQASLSSSVFRQVIRSCIALMHTPDELTASEWLNLLILLVTKCSSSDCIQDISSSIESKSAARLSNDLNNFNKVKSAREMIRPPNELSDDDTTSSVEEVLDDVFEGDVVKTQSSSERNNQSSQKLFEDRSINVESQSEEQNQVDVTKNELEDQQSLQNLVPTEEDILRRKREMAFLARNKREKKREEALMGFYIGRRLKSTAASFEEDFLSAIVHSTLCNQEEGLNLPAVRCSETCHYCGLSDVALGAPLCRVPSDHEWEEAFHKIVHERTTYMVAQIPDCLHRNDRILVNGINEHAQGEKTKLLTVRVRVGGELVSTRANCLDKSVKNFDSAMQQFLPRNHHGFQSELAFRYESGLSFFSGSLTAHECCAIAAHRSRAQKLLQERRRRHEINLSRNAAISCGKSTPIGVDNWGRSYWIFSSEPSSLFICESIATPEAPEPQCKKWRRFQKPEEIASIIVCLGRDPPCQTVEEAFPEARELARDRRWSSLLLDRKFSKLVPKKNSPALKLSKVQQEAEEDFGPPFVEDEEILVESENGKFLWDAVVVDVSKDPETQKVNGYLVHYKNWNCRFDHWVSPSRVVEPSRNNLLVQKEVLEEFAVFKQATPPFLQGMFALKFLTAKNRARSTPIVSPDIFDCVVVRTHASQDEKLLGALKGAVLLVEAALPLGSIGPSENGQWSSQGAALWRNLVKNATGPEALMKCMLLLEDVISQDWLHPQAYQLFSALPRQWRAVCEATLPSIALRVLLLDKGLKYKFVGRGAKRSS